MNDKEKIRAEIERQYEAFKAEYARTKGAYVAGRMDALDYIEQFIDSLPEEPTIDAEIVKDIHNLLHVKSGPLPMPSKHRLGNKVRIIILPEEGQ